MFLSNEIRNVLRLINENGYKTYLVGGYVRDSLLNKKTYDVDITTSATPEVLIEIFKEYNIEKKFANYGSVKFNYNEYKFEITTFRKESNYINHRKPQSVEFVRDLEQDLPRRDFAINAICYDGNEIIDLYKGIDDLNNKMIRTIGDPLIRFEEDALRVLRALRFCSVLGFTIENNTSAAIRAMYSNLKDISFDSLYKELKGILEGENYINVLKEYKNELEEIFSLERLLVDKFKENMSYAEKEALFFYDCGQIKIKNKYLTCKNIEFYENKILLKKTLMKYGKESVYNCLYFNCYVLGENKKDLILLEEILNNKECYNLKMLDISGEDLLNIGIKNNKIGKYLNILLEAVIENKCNNDKLELFDYLNKIVD